MATGLLHRAAHPRSIKNIPHIALDNPAIAAYFCELIGGRSSSRSDSTRMNMLNIFLQFYNIIAYILFSINDCDHAMPLATILISNGTVAIFFREQHRR